MKRIFLFLGAFLCLLLIAGGALVKCDDNYKAKLKVDKAKKDKNKEPRRLAVKFSVGATKLDKVAFFKELGAEPIAWDVFEYDIAGWKKVPSKETKEKLNKLYKTELLYGGAFLIQEYEIEDFSQREKPIEGEFFKGTRSGCVKHKPDNIFVKKRIVPWYEEFIEAEKAHEFLRKKKIHLVPNGIVIVDDGPQLSHPDIAPALKYKADGKPIYWVNKVNVEEDIWGNHGTHVACLAGGARNNFGVEGIAAPNSYILPLIVKYDDFGRFFASDIAIGLKYYMELEEMGMVRFRVINMSFHMSWPSVVAYAAMKTLSDKLFVVAAGNGRGGLGMNVGDSSNYPAKWKMKNQINVAAMREDGKLTRWSNYGVDYVEIAAPGNKILSCVKKGGYGVKSGTSMASPLTVGTASLIFSVKPDLDIASLKSVLFFGAKGILHLKDKVKNGNSLYVYGAIENLMFRIENDGWN